VVLRAEHNFVLLNLYPYTSGHLMIAPYAHVATLDEARPDALAEMMSLAARAERAFRTVYNAAGVNLGMNLGKAAGAACRGHIHMHCPAALAGRCEFHDDDRRDARAARGFVDGVGEVVGGVEVRFEFTPEPSPISTATIRPWCPDTMYSRLWRFALDSRDGDLDSYSRRRLGHAERVPTERFAGRFERCSGSLSSKRP
jgi:diadenosine tetraphosphate (Ap4A) HIT family hydrolase